MILVIESWIDRCFWKRCSR